METRQFLIQRKHSSVAWSDEQNAQSPFRFYATYKELWKRSFGQSTDNPITGELRSHKLRPLRPLTIE